MFKVPENKRITTQPPPLGTSRIYGNNGTFYITDDRGCSVFAAASDQDRDWEYVRVSGPGLTLEMVRKVRNLFWGTEDTVVQFHPPESQVEQQSVHLWRLKEDRDKIMDHPPKCTDCIYGKRHRMEGMPGLPRFLTETGAILAEMRRSKWARWNRK